MRTPVLILNLAGAIGAMPSCVHIYVGRAGVARAELPRAAVVLQRRVLLVAALTLPLRALERENGAATCVSLAITPQRRSLPRAEPAGGDARGDERREWLAIPAQPST